MPSTFYAEFDAFSQLAKKLDRIIDAELFDFVWESCFVERDLAAWEDFDDDDSSGDIQMMLKTRQFNTVEVAEQAFLSGERT